MIPACKAGASLSCEIIGSIISSYLVKNLIQALYNRKDWLEITELAEKMFETRESLELVNYIVKQGFVISLKPT